MDLRDTRGTLWHDAILENWSTPSVMGEMVWLCAGDLSPPLVNLQTLYG